MLFLAQAKGRLWRPLLREKDTRLLHRRYQDFKFFPVKNQAVFGLAVATAHIVPFKEWAESVFENSLLQAS